MKICFISRRFFPTISGMSVYALNLLRELIRTGHDVTMVSQYRGDELGVRVYGGGKPPAVEGVKIIGLEAKGEQQGGAFEQDIAEIVEVVCQEHALNPFDVIHAQYGYPTGLAALMASRRLQVPNVVSIQGGDGHWVGTCCQTHKLAMLAVLNHADALLIGSRSFAAEVEDNHGTPLDRFTIVPGAVDVHRFCPRADWQPGIWLDEQTPTLLYHGRVDARKGVLDLLDAFAQLRRRSCFARLVISGIGPDVDATTAKVCELELNDVVEMSGYVAYDDVPDVYRRADIFISPTYAEGFSNTILEAMASGVPVISTRAVGVVDCIRHGENGLLVEPRDPHALSTCIERMIVDSDLRATLTKNALDEARQQYSWEKVTRQIVGVYRRVQDTATDTRWQIDPAITPCRFRLSPHLL